MIEPQMRVPHSSQPHRDEWVPSTSIRSMTGYATAQATTEDHTGFTLTIKSVNHRFLDLHLRLPDDCDALEPQLRRLVKDYATRGHIELVLQVNRQAREAAPAVHLNRDLLAAWIAAFHEASSRHDLKAEPNLNELLRLPGVMAAEPSAPQPARTSGHGIEAAVLNLAPSLLAAFNEVRAAEGTALAAELRASMLRLRTLAEEAATLRAGAREAHFERLRTRLAELLGSDETPDQRVLAEAAMLVERSDIEEELVRLRAHIDSFLAMLEAGGELGKRLDFLLQELNREANTMLSKTSGTVANGLRLTTLGLEIKAEIEKAREQVQNLE